MFHCEKRSLDLSVHSCIADFNRVDTRGTHSWRSDWHCRGCEIGAANAGRDVEELRTAAIVAQARQICARCHRARDRFIGNRLCRSCHARDRELARGRNSKGTFPRELAQRWRLHPVALRIVRAKGHSFYWTIERASDLMDALITVIRQKQVTIFARMPTAQYGRNRPTQLSFWGGC